MKLTQHTDYAIRVLMFAASKRIEQGENTLSSIREIAEAYGISENHLMKVVHKLAGLGWLETIRGRNGGLRLAGDPRSIRVGDVVRAVEEDMNLVECFGEGSTCPLTSDCRLAKVLDAARSEFLKSLDQHTLGDLLPRARTRQIVALSGVLAQRVREKT